MFKFAELLFCQFNDFQWRISNFEGNLFCPVFMSLEKPHTNCEEWFNSMETNFWNRSNVMTLVIKVKIKNGKKKDSKLPNLRLILSNWSYLLAKKLSLKMSGLNLMRYLTFILGQNENKKIETWLFLHSKIVKWLWFKF